MNPLKTIAGTLICGFVISLIALMFGITWPKQMLYQLVIWLHVLSGVTWIGLLYYFNFVQMPALATAATDTDGPGPAAIGKYITPTALLWFRMAAASTFIFGLFALEMSTMPNVSIIKAYTFAEGARVIGFGSWLGTIMLFNVWVLIWPNQQKILGIVKASAEQVAKAKVIATMASRTNVMLSIPMLLAMVAWRY